MTVPKTALAMFTREIIKAYGKLSNPFATLRGMAIAGFRENPLIGTVQIIPAYTINGIVTDLTGFYNEQKTQKKERKMSDFNTTTELF